MLGSNDYVSQGALLPVRGQRSSTGSPCSLCPDWLMVQGIPSRNSYWGIPILPRTESPAPCEKKVKGHPQGALLPVKHRQYYLAQRALLPVKHQQYYHTQRALLPVT